VRYERSPNWLVLSCVDGAAPASSRLTHGARAREQTARPLPPRPVLQRRRLSRGGRARPSQASPSGARRGDLADAHRLAHLVARAERRYRCGHHDQLVSRAELQKLGGRRCGCRCATTLADALLMAAWALVLSAAVRAAAAPAARSAAIASHTPVSCEGTSAADPSARGDRLPTTPNRISRSTMPQPIAHC
jgi:hypothetical protein